MKHSNLVAGSTVFSRRRLFSEDEL